MGRVETKKARSSIFAPDAELRRTANERRKGEMNLAMSDKVLFSSDRTYLDGRRISVTAERGYGDIIVVKVSNDDGEFSIFLHENDEAMWLGDALMEAAKASAE